ncbi:sensor histidine kinase [Sphaerisporangium rhizosphaerae]|uniref:Signal transduction histidine-protein kinase/phosphatase MprB n=1 Tax=Sphaerisporangium rhizosphaerae TaxID=2269375 RepID=A0ABW2P4R6_9ACTN
MRERCRPRSVRGQVTLLAVTMTVLTLLTTGAGMYFLAATGPDRWRGDLPGPSLTGAETRLRPPHGRSRPPAHVMQVTVVAPVRRSGASASHGPLPDVAWLGSVRLIVALEAAELVALNAWAAWKVTGRLLRPMETVGAELSVIDFDDLTVRVSEPGRAQEVTCLARAINRFLGRLNRAKEEREEIAYRQRQFASDVSHELRTPIAGLRVRLEEAQQDPGRARLPELLGTTLDQVERLQMITDDVLRLARVRGCPPAEPQRLDLAALVRMEMAQRTDRVPVRLQLARGAIVEVVPSQIGRLLANLLDNAQRHARHLVTVEVHATETAVELAVGDDGPGIAKADRERVFHRFTRLEDARRLDGNGTGLGLAIAREIAQAHRGSLGVEESAFQGARFVLRLPGAGSGERRSS